MSDPLFPEGLNVHTPARQYVTGGDYGCQVEAGQGETWRVVATAWGPDAALAEARARRVAELLAFGEPDDQWTGHLSDVECRSMLEAVASQLEGEDRVLVHASGEEEEANIAETVGAIVAERAAAVARAESAEDLLSRVFARRTKDTAKTARAIVDAYCADGADAHEDERNRLAVFIEQALVEETASAVARAEKAEAERDLLHDHFEDWEASNDKVLSEACPPDERHCGCVPFLRKRIAAAERERDEARAQKDGAYSERDQLVAALTKLFPAYLARHPKEDASWEDEWRWIVFIDAPTGQMSWHIHDSELPLFGHLTERRNRWDGHSNEEKYSRLGALTPGVDALAAAEARVKELEAEVGRLQGICHRAFGYLPNVSTMAWVDFNVDVHAMAVADEFAIVSAQVAAARAENERLLGALRRLATIPSEALRLALVERLAALAPREESTEEE